MPLNLFKPLNNNNNNITFVAPNNPENDTDSIYP